VVLKQLDYLRSKDLGFEKEQVVVVSMNAEEARTEYEGMREDLLVTPGIAQVSAARLSLDGGYGSTSFVAEGYGDERVRMRLYPVNYHFVETLGMDMVEGQAFSEERAVQAQSGFLINEAAVRSLEWEEPVVGKRLRALDYASGDRTVVGVVKDFHYTPLHEEVMPLVMFYRPENHHFMYVRINTQDVTGVLDHIARVWEARIPAYPFEFQFLDERVDSQYRTEEDFATLIQAFAVLAVLIACFGLFGLASFIAERRTKEIGVRKVLGASVGSLIGLLLRRFLGLAGISFLLAVPLAYGVMGRWLADFAYRIEMGVMVFIVAGGLMFTIALVSVGYQAIRAALTDPVKSLRYE
jgi:putative ABC transport system permease protein